MYIKKTLSHSKEGLYIDVSHYLNVSGSKKRERVRPADELCMYMNLELRTLNSKLRSHFSEITSYLAYHPAYRPWQGHFLLVGLRSHILW
jgi:hypothetical protein